MTTSTSLPQTEAPPLSPCTSTAGRRPMLVRWCMAVISATDAVVLAGLRIDDLNG
jgi:hypothetical protein